MTQKATTTVDKLWDAAAQHFPEFSPEEQRVGLTLLGELMRGEPVSVSRLGGALDIDDQEAARYLEETSIHPFAYPGDAGPVQAFWGLSTVPTNHRFIVDGRTLWASCAVDALFLPELLNVTASVESEDPESGEPVNLRVSPTAIEVSHPDGLVVSMSSPEAWDATSAIQLMLTACHTTHFFASPETGTRWTSSHPKTVLLTLEEAFKYGRRQNEETFGDRLDRPGSAGT